MLPFDRSVRGVFSLSILFLSSTALWAAGPAGSPAVATVTDDDTSAPQTFALHDQRKALHQKPQRALPSERRGLDLSLLPEVRLPGVDAQQLLRADEEASAGSATKVLRIGIGRDVPPLSARDGNWYELDGGARLWAVEVASTDALAVKLHFRDVHLPSGAELAVYAPSAVAPETERKARSLAAARDPWEVDFHDPVGTAGAATDFWTGTRAGATARIEYYLPAGAAGQELAPELPFTVDRLQHVYRDPVADLLGGTKSKIAGPCHNDVSCYPEWADTASAVAGIAFVDTDFLYCTGQLLNSQKPDFTPYWLTAHHCLSAPEDAQAAEIFWLYQTASCGGPRPALTSSPRSAGATLLATSSSSDYTLLMIEGTLPPGLTWAGWTSKAVPTGTPSTVIHHPDGDYKRISFGDKGTSDICGSNNLVRVNWTDGPTEPGSSGSGVFTNAKQQLYGQLFFGPSACGNETYDCFGAFTNTYKGIGKFLRTGGSDDKSEQNDTCQKARVVKAGVQGGRIVKSVDPDWYKITVPAHKTLTVTVTFNQPFGDIDLKFFPSCGGEPLITSEGETNSETFTVQNVGTRPAVGLWQVYLFSDVRNSYDLAVSLQ